MSDSRIKQLESRIEQLESRLAASQQHMAQANDRETVSRLLLDSLPVYISYVDGDHRYRFVNRLYEAWLDQSRQQIEGRHVSEILGEDTYAYCRPFLERCLAGETIEYELRIDEKDGPHYYSVVHVPDIRDAGVEGVFVLVTDITASKVSLNALIEARDEAEAASEAKSQFLARMSHELRTPLNSIIGYAQLYELNNSHTGRGQHKYITEILKASRHLLQLITDLLDLSKIETNKIELSMESVSANEIIDECLHTIAPLADERDISISSSCDHAADKWINADSVRIRQVLLNILSNAVKYNTEEGRVEISYEKTWGNRLRINIHDTGPGIQESEINNLFEPFNRLYLRTYAVEGSGIGLALSKQLIELMNGRIGVDSEYGKGSTFWIELDLADEHPEPARLAPAYDDDYAAGVRSTLLYVEDSPTHMNLVKDILETMPDIRFIGASTPMLGLELARTHKPDVVLLDICLPGMDGYEFFEHLQKQKASSHIPVIGLSASALSEEIEKGLRMGFRRYLTKPIDIPELKKAIKEVIRDSETR